MIIIIKWVEARVIQDYIPSTNAELTLILDDTVYIFKTEVPGKPGYWEGETNNVMGIFPSKHVKPEAISTGAVDVKRAI